MPLLTLIIKKPQNAVVRNVVWKYFSLKKHKIKDKMYYNKIYQHIQKYSNVSKRGYYMNKVHSLLFLKAEELQKLHLFS